VIVHVASGREWRGGQHQVLLLATGLHRADVPTLVVTGAGTTLAARLHDAGVAVEEVGWAIGLDPRVAIRVMTLIRPGVTLHVHDSHAHALADLAARARRAPIVVTRRVVFPIRSPQRYRRAAAVIAISNAVQRQVVDAGVDAHRVHLVPDAIDPATIPTESANQHAGNDVPPTIVCIAALMPEKGIDILLDAAAMLRASHPDARWRVVGEGSARAALEAHRHRLDLDAVVEFASTIPAGAALSVATLAVQPSRSEGLGSAALQALACGVPLVVSDAGGLPDVVAQGGGVVIPRESPAALAETVGRLLDSPGERASLAAQGRAASVNFTVDRLVERTRRVYRSVASTRDGA
jgi:glycosyltransferase involved in cell wall biosynthesis